MSLSCHLTSPAAAHGRLAFHPDCPRCCAERLAGQLGGDELVPRRAQAALAAGLLAISAAAPPAVAVAQELPQQQEGTTDPGGEPPEMAPEFDPGGDEGDTDVVELAPLPGGDQSGGEHDDGDGPPVEAEEPIEAAPEIAPAPEPELPPGDEPEPVPLAPAPPPAPAPPAAAVQPVPVAPPGPPPAAPETPSEAGKRKSPERQIEPRERVRRQARPAPAPVAEPVSPDPAPAPAPAAVETVPVAQMDTPSKTPVKGESYTVREGDSLWSIARRMLRSDASNGKIAREVNRLWELNTERIGTGNPSMLHIGTVLRLR